MAKITKSRTTAIVLAIFFGGLSWFYTWKYDAWKFWLNLILCFITFGLFGIVTWIWAIVDMAIKEDEIFKNY